MFRRGLVGYLPVNILQAAAGFGSIVLFTRLLNPASYGAYALGFSSSALATLVFLTWIEAAMARFYAAESSEERRRDLFATLYAAFAAAAAALLLTGGLCLLLPLPGEYRRALAAGLVAALLRSLLKLSQERRRAAGEVGGFALLDALQTSLGFAAGVGLAFAGWGAAAPLAGQALASGLAAALCLPKDLGEALKGRVRSERLATYAAYGVPVALSLIMGLALSTTDRFVLAADLDGAAVGAYHAGYMLSSRTLDILFIWLGMAGQPACVAALERGGRRALEPVARAQAEAMVLLAAPASVGLMLVARPLCALMIGPALAPAAATVTPVIALSAALCGLTTHYFSTAYTLARRTRRLFLALAVPALLNLVLVLVLVPLFGLRGAVAATLASYALGLGVSIALAPKDVRLPFPLQTLFKAAVATGAMAAAVNLLPATGGLSELALKAALGAAVYAAAALLLDVAGVRGRALALLFGRGGPSALRLGAGS